MHVDRPYTTYKLKNTRHSLYVHVRHALRVCVRQEQAQAAQDGGGLSLCQHARGADVIKQLATCIVIDSVDRLWFCGVYAL